MQPLKQIYSLVMFQIWPTLNQQDIVTFMGTANEWAQPICHQMCEQEACPENECFLALLWHFVVVGSMKAEQLKGVA